MAKPPTNKFTLIGLFVSARVRRMISIIPSGVKYATPSDPSPTALETAAASSGVPGPPPMGARITGCSMPSLCNSAFRLIFDSCAVSVALQHPQVPAPRAHGFPVLMGHHSRDLVQAV